MRREGLQPAAAEDGPGGQRGEGGDGRDEGAQDQPRPAAGEESQVAAARRAPPNRRRRRAARAARAATRAGVRAAPTMPCATSGCASVTARPTAAAPSRPTAAPHSGTTSPGCLRTICSTVRHSATGRIASHRNGTASGGAYASRRCSCAVRDANARRRRRAAVQRRRAARRRRRRTTATSAVGTSSTRAPVRRARTPRSSPSSAPASARSMPPSSRHASVRARTPRMSEPSTSSRASCWPWSSSASARPTVRPKRGHARAERDDLGAVVPSDELRGDERDRRTELERADQASERFGLGGGVLREDPHRVARDPQGRHRRRRGEARRCGRGDHRLGAGCRGHRGDARDRRRTPRS